ncbi:hypothetical protein ACQE32_17715 [Pantoea sp. FN0302]|uniref:hypothetical protein n=1 Tax=Pantoea sp. FN0302 TaxID=3418558 RepID=UPI003CF58937
MGSRRLYGAPRPPLNLVPDRSQRQTAAAPQKLSQRQTDNADAQGSGEWGRSKAS